MAELLPKDGFESVIRLDTETNRIQINNTVFDNTNKDGGYKGSVKMIEGVLNKKYVIHSTPFYRKNRDLALFLIK